MHLEYMFHEVRWMAWTVALEAAYETYEGKLGVAWVIANRAKASDWSVTDTVLAPLAFSVWNTQNKGRLQLDALPPHVWVDAFKAAAAAYFELEPDPTKGATHYLNVEAVLTNNPEGSWREWFDPNKVTVKIGRHTFLKL